MEKQKQVNKKILSFFMLAFPTVIIVLIGLFMPNPVWVQVVLAFYQFVLMKQFLDTYYENF